MSDIIIRPAVESDIPRLEALLYQVHGLHAEGRPDLFIPGCKKYTADQLRGLLTDRVNTPIFAAILEGELVGYCFCVRQVQTAASMQKITPYLWSRCWRRLKILQQRELKRLWWWRKIPPTMALICTASDAWRSCSKSCARWRV